LRSDRAKLGTEPRDRTCAPPSRNGPGRRRGCRPRAEAHYERSDNALVRALKRSTSCRSLRGQAAEHRRGYPRASSPSIRAAGIIMKNNSMKAKLLAGEPALGCSIMIPSPQAVEMIAHCGFDWVLIDLEHGTIDLETAEIMIMAAEANRITPI